MQFVWNRPNHLDASDLLQLADLLDREIGLAADEPLGGKSLARATVEYTFPIIEKARGAVFYDTGFVNPDSYDFSLETQTVPRHATSKKAPIEFDNLASDVGIGLRLDLPIGPLRLDYGFPLQRAGNAGHGRFNFNVGYQF